MANIKYRDDLRENKILNQAKRDLNKIHNIHPSRIYQVVFVSYFAQALCKNPSLRFFEQHLEASKVEAFAGETPGESIGKSEKEIFHLNVLVAKRPIRIE